MNKMLDDWYEDLGRQDRYRERFESIDDVVYKI